VKGLGVALLALVAACSTSQVETRRAPELASLRAMGYRVAVLPFAVTAPDDDFLASSLAPVGEVLDLEIGSRGLPERDSIGALFRRQVIGWLGSSSFEVVEPWSTDTALTHRGLDATALRDRGRAAEIATALGVDGVLYGEVTRWNRSYYVVEAGADVGLRLELIDGHGGQSLFFTERHESAGAGLSGGPTGFVSAASAPVAGLSSAHLRSLTRTACRLAALDLAGDVVGDEPQPASAPRLSWVSVALPHDGPLLAGDRIDLLALGTEGCEVRCDLGALRTGLLLPATATQQDSRGDRTTYAGHYIVQAGDAARALPVFTTIGRAQQNRASRSRYRWAGTVDLGAAPPATSAPRAQ
jgi:hypothetical protein